MFHALDRARPPALDVRARPMTSSTVPMAAPWTDVCDDSDARATPRTRRMEDAPSTSPYASLGKSAARQRVERALGGAMEYACVSRRARAEAEDEAAARIDGTQEREGTEAWRRFPDDETRAFAIEARAEIERRARGVIEALADAAASERRMEREAEAMERRVATTATTATRGLRVGRISRVKTNVAFGTTVRG